MRNSSMKLTKNSKKLMSFFIENKLMGQHTSQTTSTNNILIKIFNELNNAQKFIDMKKREEGKLFYHMNISKINNVSQIPKPKIFNANSFTNIVRNHIDLNSNYKLSYTFSLFDREINIEFIVEEVNSEIKIEYYNNYVDKILVWLCFINEYASKKCSSKITIFIYLTSLKKNLPDTNITILDENHANTAFTYTCPKISEIVIYRKEEWFKVFIHETFHNFALDFSDLNLTKTNQFIFNIFQVKSEINLFEAYSEFWAEIMNAVFCSYYLTLDKENIDDFLSNCEFFIQFEITYSIFQMVKVLQFMGLTYKDLYLNESKVLRDTLYKEKTNILSYYVIKCILMYNYQSLLKWCEINNLSLIQFKKTPSNLMKFCEFIETHYKKKSMLDKIDKMQNILKYVNLKKGKNNEFLSNNMRMTICEMG